LEFSQALANRWIIVNEVNKYIEDAAPWKEQDQGTLSNTLYTLAESLRLIGLYLYPFMPSTSQKIWHNLGINKKIDDCQFAIERQWGRLQSGTVIQPGAQLFPRIEKISESGSGQDSVNVDKKKKVEKKMEKTEETSKPAPVVAAGPDLIGIEDFMKVDLRVGKIVSAERVEKSEKLVKLKVDIGAETRQVVAGIGKSYSPEDLLGKSIVIVANLKPAKLMGIESQGMLLAASSGDLLAVATFDRETKQGSRVK
jgi:methionyl-tRNA synthetase